jgi:hypothetical protein
VNNNEVQLMINETFIKVFDDNSETMIALRHSIKQEVYKEIADSLKSAGELDLYNFQSIEEQCSAHTARNLGDRVSWLVQS